MPGGPKAARLALPLAAFTLCVLLLAGCGGAGPKGPPDLLFVSTRDGDYAIFGANAKGKHAHRLTKQEGDPSTDAGLFFQVDPAWSPDGRLIVFSSRRSGRTHLYEMRADGTGTRALTGGRHDDDRPSWSPDGKRIVFEREGALYVVPAGGGAARRLGKGPGAASDPAWSPDGELIAYDYRRPGYSSHEIWTMHADGSARRQLTNFGALSAWPSWSPDGKRIAFHSDARYGRFEIYSIGVDGKGLRAWTTSVLDCLDPAWSPDGSRIAFSRDGELWTVDTAGKETRLTSGGHNDTNPVWRPAPRG